MGKFINIIAAIICIISVMFNWGYYFGTSDTKSKILNDRLAQLETQNDNVQGTIKNIENQLAYIRGYLSKQALSNTAVNFNVDQAIKASSEINLPPSEFTQLFSTINSLPIPEAKKYLKENTKFSDEQINAIFKTNIQ